MMSPGRTPASAAGPVASATRTPALISSRDNPPPQSALQQRVARAGNNLQESLPAYLALCLLAMIQQVDLSQAALAWLVLRVIYIPCYMFNIIYVRSLVWGASLASLIYMAVKLV